MGCDERFPFLCSAGVKGALSQRAIIGLLLLFSTSELNLIKLQPI
jgi:hypothetical protein